MKKNYEAPELEVIAFAVEDHLTVSGTGNGPVELPPVDLNT